MSKWDKTINENMCFDQKTSGLMNCVRYWKAMDM